MISDNKKTMLACHDALEPRLRDLGFAIHDNRVFRKPLTPHTEGALTLTWYMDPRTTGISFSAAIGVKFLILAQLHRELRGTPPEQPDNGRGTVSRTLALLAQLDGGARPRIFWTAASPDDAVAAADGLAATVRDYGLPFFKKCDSVRTAIKLMGPDVYRNSIYLSYELMVAYAAIGERNSALKIFNHWATRLDELGDCQLTEFRKFRDSFLARVDRLPAAGGE